jgi:hypothetical protein
VVLHSELEYIAALSARTVTKVQLLLGLYRERGGFFVMEGATGKVILALLFEIDDLPYFVNDIHGLSNLLDKVVRECHL